MLSAPIRKRPKAFRDTIGWAAVVTLFNAMCLWMYVLFFRSPEPPPPKPVAAHETTKDSHGKAATPAKADSHGKPDAGAKAPEPKKKSTKTAEKKPAKKG